MAFLISCPCECGEAVTASDFGFSETSVSVEPCEALRRAGVVSSRVRKSAAYARTVSASAGVASASCVCGMTHRDGLVALGGA